MNYCVICREETIVDKYCDTCTCLLCKDCLLTYNKNECPYCCGKLNFLKVNNLKTFIDLKPLNDNEITVYAISYDLSKIGSGLCGLQYSN